MKAAADEKRRENLHQPISLEQDFAEKVEKASDVSALAAETRACST